MAKRDRSHIHPLDAVRLGADVAAVKASMPAARWKNVVRYAHGRGFTARGALTDGPYALKERTQRSLLEQARKSVEMAYGNAGRELDEQERRLQALDARRSKDNEVYRNWLTQQQAVNAGTARAAQTRYEQYLAQLQTDQAARWQQAQAGAMQQAQGAPGTVSNMSQSLDLQGLGADAKVATDRVANERAKTAAMLPSLESLLGAQNANVQSLAQNAELERQAQLQAGTFDIGQQRLKLQAERGGAQADEFKRLQGNEYEKAAGSRDFSAAAEKLGLEGEKFAYQQSRDAKDYSLKTKQFNLDRWIADNKVSADRAKRRIDYEKIRRTEGQKAADRELRRELKRLGVSEGSAKVSDSQRKESSKGAQTVETVLGTLRDLHKDPRFTNGKTKKGTTMRQYLRRQGYSDTAIDVAEDLRKHNGKLSARGRAKARLLGIRNPQDIYGVA